MGVKILNQDQPLNLEVPKSGFEVDFDVRVPFHGVVSTVFWDGLREGCLSGVFIPRVPDRRSKMLSVTEGNPLGERQAPWQGVILFAYFLLDKQEKVSRHGGEKQNWED
jgi:hypothetical protein